MTNVFLVIPAKLQQKKSGLQVILGENAWFYTRKPLSYALAVFVLFNGIRSTVGLPLEKLLQAF